MIPIQANVVDEDSAQIIDAEIYALTDNGAVLVDEDGGNLIDLSFFNLVD
jgi:hypothetical protein